MIADQTKIKRKSNENQTTKEISNEIPRNPANDGNNENLMIIINVQQKEEEEEK